MVKITQQRFQTLQKAILKKKIEHLQFPVLDKTLSPPSVVTIPLGTPCIFDETFESIESVYHKFNVYNNINLKVILCINNRYKVTNIPIKFSNTISIFSCKNLLLIFDFIFFKGLCINIFLYNPFDMNIYKFCKIYYKKNNYKMSQINTFRQFA